MNQKNLHLTELINRVGVDTDPGLDPADKKKPDQDPTFTLKGIESAFLSHNACAFEVSYIFFFEHDKV